jgi:uncharacterized protein (TIGR02246 family)
MIKQVLSIACVTVAQFLVACLACGQATTPPPTAANSATAANSKIEQEIRAGADAFVEAFKKRDAAAIAAQWTADGVYINEDGQRFEGQTAIQSEYETFFKDCPDDLEMRVEVDSVRLINANTAIEEGRTAVTPQPPGEPRVMSRYTAVNVNQDGRWLIAELRDSRVELPADAGTLEDLLWLVGNWGATKGDLSVEVKCRSVENNRFLLRTSAVTEAGKPTDGGLEVIGVNPATGRITSWSFTNDGGHAMGVWTPLEGSWAVESVGVMEDGTESSATYILSREGDDSLTWKSVDRMVGDALLPDMAEVTLKRQE